MPYSILIGGNAVQALPGSLSFSFSVGRKSSGSVTVRTDTNTFFLQYQQIQAYDQYGQLVFSGYITQPKATLNLSKQSLIWTLQCISQDYIAKKRVYTANWTNKTCGYIVQDVMNTVLASEGVTRGQIYDGLTPSTTLYPSPTLYPGGNVGLVPQAIFYYTKVSDVLDAMVKEASSSGIPYYWMIDQNKQLWFVPYTSVAGPDIDASQIDHKNNPPSVTYANPNYRNTQYITGGVAQTSQMTETRQGDGKTRTFTMSYPLAAVPSAFTVNGTTKTVGLKGTSGSNYYYAVNDPVITQDTGETILVSTDTLSITYIGQFPNTAIVSNAAQISYQAGVDGTSGINEEVENDPTLTTSTNALSEGSNLLTRLAQQGAQFSFTTKQSGFIPGQICNVNIPQFNFNSTQVLVETVTVADLDGINIWYQITAVLGPYDTTWVQFFSKLLSQQVPASSVNIGSTQQTSILQQFTATITPSAVLNASAIASLFPGVGVHPNTTLDPAG